MAARFFAELTVNALTLTLQHQHLATSSANYKKLHFLALTALFAHLINCTSGTYNNYIQRSDLSSHPEEFRRNSNKDGMIKRLLSDGDIGNIFGGGGLGSLLAPLALLLSSLAFFAAVGVPLLTLLLTNTNNNMVNSINGATGTAGTLSVVPANTPATGRRRRGLFQALNSTDVLLQLETTFKLYDTLREDEKRSITCHVIRNGHLATGLSGITKNFITNFRYIKDFNINTPKFSSKLNLESFNNLLKMCRD